MFIEGTPIETGGGGDVRTNLEAYQENVWSLKFYRPGGRRLGLVLQTAPGQWIYL